MTAPSANPMAATKIRQAFYRTLTNDREREREREGDQREESSMPATTNPGGPNGRTVDPDERTSLLNRWASTHSGTPYHKHDKKAIRYPFLVLHLTWEILKTNYVNVLLVFVPIGIVAGLAGWSPVLQFVLNFIAIIPLASLLAFATEELAVPLGQTIGGLLNATFGNAVELIVSIIALQRTISALSRPVCWAASCPTSCSCWAAASSWADCDSRSKRSTRRWLRPCPRS